MSASAESQDSKQGKTAGPRERPVDERAGTAPPREEQLEHESAPHPQLPPTRIIPWFEGVTKTASSIPPGARADASNGNLLEFKRLGRYEVQRVLGQGGFGIVFLAFDPQLGRQVALKVPRRERFANREELDRFLSEARAAARLKHPLLVAIYDVQLLDDVPFIVQEYVESRNLAEWYAAVRPSFEEIARVMADVAAAVGYIHQVGLVHCDLKVANILMDAAGMPHVTDFGIATHESEQHLLKGKRYGTPYAMAPEQVRGESHLMDGRTDVWALGVMLYQMLTGRLPFSSPDRDELFEMIRTHDPKPPRQIDRKVPKELEFICLKCLSRRRADRYNTAEDLREDIQNWLQQDHSGNLAPATAAAATTAPASSRSELLPTIVPKGLRAYDAEDADFFLSLLPGPRDREGLPESVRFWRNRIREHDPDQTFRVGLLYGPSGCGKSSLVKAGLLPRLKDDVLTIYVEAVADGTEARILAKLRNQFPTLPENASLREACALLRKRADSSRRKVLLVVDQFEQWLHAHPVPKDSPLVDALRQCDGGKLQALLMVRDDFFLSVNRVFQELEIRLVEGTNCGMVDYFDADHSRKVLAFLGRAYGKLDETLTSAQQAFLKQAVNDLAEDGKMICVRLALFADMMKSRPWIPSSLQRVGGVKGVGVAMLDESFNPETAPLSHRIHEDAIRRVLKAMLPNPGTDIKGAMQSVEHLREVSGYENKPREFDELIEILDSERRLITPADSAGTDLDGGEQASRRNYQLTHDYLVPSLRTWLTRKQSERLRGRAELRLADLAADWGAKPESKRLPALWEFAGIRLLTNSTYWNPEERKVMRAAVRFHGKRWGAALVAVILMATAAWYMVSKQQERVARERIEDRRRQADLAIDAALHAPASAVPYAADSVEQLREHALPILRERFGDQRANPAERLRLAVLLSSLGEPPMQYLIDAIDSADHSECPNVLASLRVSGDGLFEQLQEKLDVAERESNRHLKAKVALTMLQLGAAGAALQMSRANADPAERVQLIEALPKWHGPLEPLLDSIDESRPPAFRSAILLGIGRIPREELSPAEVDEATSRLARWYHDMPDSGTHGAAEWTLRQWNRPPAERPASADAGRDWQTNSIGMTLVKVPPRSASPSTTTEFWLSDRETSRRLFQKFVDDPNCPADAKPANWKSANLERSPTEEHPVQHVGWNDAVLFCNWLSRREKRDECYAWNGTFWELKPGANGYRLPTEAEWEHACRAGTTTEFVSGGDDQFLGGYAVYRANQTAVCGSKMPNPWGLFDMHGNVYEWCQDWFYEGRERALRSGAFDYDASKARASNRQSNSATYRSYTVGFRVARNLE